MISMFQESEHTCILVHHFSKGVQELSSRQVPSLRPTSLWRFRKSEKKKVEKKTKRSRKSPVSQIKRLGPEAGYLVRDASTASKSSPHRSIYIFTFYNLDKKHAFCKPIVPSS